MKYQMEKHHLEVRFVQNKIYISVIFMYSLEGFVFERIHEYLLNAHKFWDNMKKKRRASNSEQWPSSFQNKE